MAPAHEPTPHTPRLAGKVCLVTGAARGIGAACARQFVRHGARVVLTDIAIDDASRLAASLGSQAFARRLDVRREQDWIDVLAWTTQSVGPLNVLVNNAGITGIEAHGMPHDPENTSLDDWRSVHATNLDGVFLGCKHAIAAMKESGGSIINVSSRSGIVGVPGAAAYASSKAAVRNHSKSVALFCAQQGYRIRCNSIHPGAILTPMWEPLLGTGEARRRALAHITAGIPLGRMGDPDDVALAAVYLASDESAYVTGSELHVDGGILAGEASPPVPKNGEGARVS